MNYLFAFKCDENYVPVQSKKDIKMGLPGKPVAGSFEIDSVSITGAFQKGISNLEDMGIRREDIIYVQVSESIEETINTGSYEKRQL